MSVTSEASWQSFLIANPADPLTIPFRYFHDTEVRVTRRRAGVDTELLIDDDYTVNSSTSGNTAGQLDGIIEVAGSGWIAGDTVVISRGIPVIQGSTFPYNGQLPSQTVEASYDKIVMQVQKLDDRIDRALRLPIADHGINPFSVADRANNVLGFDANGDVKWEPLNLPTDQNVTIGYSPTNYTASGNLLVDHLQGINTALAGSLDLTDPGPVGTAVSDVGWFTEIEAANNTGPNRSSVVIANPDLGAGIGRIFAYDYNQGDFTTLLLGGEFGDVGVGTTIFPANTFGVVDTNRGSLGIESKDGNAGFEPRIRLKHGGSDIFTIEGGANLTFKANDGANERMRITTAGNVGIGTANPLSRLVVSNTGNEGIEMNAGAQAGVAALDFFNRSTGQYITGNIVGNVLEFYSGPLSLETMILKDGNVGIGTTSPDHRLQVVGSIGVDGGAVAGNIYLQNAATGKGTTDGLEVGINSAGEDAYVWNYEAGDLYFGSGNSQRMRIKGDTGNVGIGTAAPASKLTVVGAADQTMTIGNDGPSMTLTNDASSPNTAATTGLLALATSAGQYGLNAGELMVATVGASRGDIVVNANYSGGGASRDVILQPSIGNVGIGTSAPATKLHVQTATNGGIVVNDGTVNGIIYGSTTLTNSFAIGTTSNHPLIFGTNNSFPQMTLATSGSVIIGATTIPDGSNDAWGYDRLNSFVRISRSTTGAASQMRFYNPNGEVGSISTSGTATAYNTSSDGRLKKGAKAADAPRIDAAIEAIEIKDYLWRADDSVGIGVIAQELAAADPLFEALHVVHRGDNEQVDYEAMQKTRKELIAVRKANKDIRKGYEAEMKAYEASVKAHSDWANKRADHVAAVAQWTEAGRAYEQWVKDRDTFQAELSAWQTIKAKRTEWEALHAAHVTWEGTDRSQPEPVVPTEVPDPKDAPVFLEPEPTIPPEPAPLRDEPEPQMLPKPADPVYADEQPIPEIKDIWQVDYSKLVPLLISYGQRTRSKLADIETRLAALEAQP